MRADLLDTFVVTAPGLSPLAAAELRAMGLTLGRVEEAGVSLRTDVAGLLRANLWLRTASRVTVRLGSFRAEKFHELERRARAIEWARVVGNAATVRLRVTCRKSRLIHSGAVAQRVGDAIRRATGARVVSGAAGADEEEAPPAAGGGAAGDSPQLFVVRIEHDRCTISADSSGELLHRRGYRQAVGKAPLRETLAAGLLLAAGYDGSTPLVDPLCGSGTIAIEGALIARRMAPGLARTFSVEQWPGFDVTRARSVRDEARAAMRAQSPVAIAGGDRDAGAIAAAEANAARAGVAADIAFARQSLSATRAPAGGPGLIATNPPYGKRVGDSDALRALYAQLGATARAHFPGWTIAMVGADRRLEGQLRLTLDERARTRNGGLPVRLLVANVPGADAGARSDGAA